MPDTWHRSLSVAMTGTRDITFTRDFDASRRLVWRAMTEPALITRWLWAREAPMTVCEQDFREGGSLRWVWRLASGQDMGLTGRYRTIAPPGRIVHTELFDQDWTGGETVVDLRLAEIAPQTTRMVMVVTYPSPEGRAMAAATPMAEGMEEGYARLAGLLPEFLAEDWQSDFRVTSEGGRRLVVSRSFAAPPARVRRAHLDPALAAKWLGSPEFPILRCEIDARVGGAFLYEWKTPDGSPLILRGTFREMGEDRIVHTEVFEPDWTGGATEVTTEFLPRGSGTQLRVTVIYASDDVRDRVAASGMTEGMAASWDLLEALL
ncbi:MAG: hypothetical protein RLZZ528_2996 [Pseudomonadota bacterium]|jgi:uncharacterized protein YndB with AHSA1/START domain